MDPVLRAIGIYIAMLLIFRLAGKRSIAQITTFDFILLLIVAEAIQQGLIGDDFSITNALLIVLTLMGIDLILAYTTQHSLLFAKVIEDVPLIIVENGKVLPNRARMARISAGEVMTAARQTQGLERMDQIKYAVLERGGEISVIPRKSEG